MFTISSHERMDYKRCPRRWALVWRLGLVQRQTSISALDLGTWVHYALEKWYVPGNKRNGSLLEHYNAAADSTLHELCVNDGDTDSFDELYALGAAMLEGYEHYYLDDATVTVVGTEIPSVFTFTSIDERHTIQHLLKPDLAYLDTHNRLRLMEHKTAASIRTQHLAIDDQARPYLAMAEAALRNAGMANRQLYGITYNYLRKSYPDTREIDQGGRYLNKDGTVSKRQPPPYYERYAIQSTRAGNLHILNRIRYEASTIAAITDLLRTRRVTWQMLGYTPHWSCPRMCPFFAVCEAECLGSDPADLIAQYERRNPYDHYRATTDVVASFEMG